MDKAKLESPFAGSVRYIFRGIHIFLGSLGQESKAYLCCLTNHYLYLYSSLSWVLNLLVVHIVFSSFPGSTLESSSQLSSRRMWNGEFSSWCNLDLEALPWFVLNERNATEWIFPRHDNVFKSQERLLGNSLALCPYGMLETRVQVQFVYMQIWSSRSYYFSILPLSLTGMSGNQRYFTKFQVWLWKLFDTVQK